MSPEQATGDRAVGAVKEEVQNYDELGVSPTDIHRYSGLEVVASRARDIVLDYAHTFDLNGTVRVLDDWLEQEV